MLNKRNFLVFLIGCLTTSFAFSMDIKKLKDHPCTSFSLVATGVGWGLKNPQTGLMAGSVFFITCHTTDYLIKKYPSLFNTTLTAFEKFKNKW
jgi:hypothetical protein